MADGDAPSHFACYCPLANECSTKGRLGWTENEIAARNKVVHHLMTSSYHELEEAKAVELSLTADLDTWGPQKSQQKSTRKQDDAQGPAKKTRQDGDGNRSSSSTALVQRAQSSQGSQAVVAAYKSRAEGAEEQINYVQSIMTRVVEQLTKSAASCKTAARFARTAAEAFETEYHAIQSSLDTIQAMYSHAPEAPGI